MINDLSTLVTSEDVLVEMDHEELGFQILQILKEREGKMHVNQFYSAESRAGIGGTAPLYERRRAKEVNMAISEAVQWLQTSILIIPEPGPNGDNGWMHLTRRGHVLVDRHRFESFREASKFPKSMLHPAFADRVWLDLARGAFDVAIFEAFKEVEIAVRDAAGLSVDDYGVDLMRNAFNPKNGKLTDKSLPEPERLALSHLFAGAFGWYRNANSHRNVAHGELSRVHEIVSLASHLLRLVDERRAAMQSAAGR